MLSLSLSPPLSRSHYTTYRYITVDLAERARELVWERSYSPHLERCRVEQLVYIRNTNEMNMVLLNVFYFVDLLS